MTAGSAHGGTVADANPSSTKSPFRTLDDANLRDKRVLLRVNAPMQDGKVSDVTRIERMAPTIAEIADKGGKVILLSHLGRPKGPDPKESLRPVALEVARIIKRPVGFVDECIGAKAQAAVDATPRRSVAPNYGGAATLETYTVAHDREGVPERAFAAALTPDGARAWGSSRDPDVMHALETEELLGHPVEISFGRLVGL